MRSLKKRCVEMIFKEFRRDFYMKIIVTIISINLAINPLLSLFCPFMETENNKNDRPTSLAISVVW